MIDFASGILRTPPLRVDLQSADRAEYNGLPHVLLLPHKDFSP